MNSIVSQATIVAQEYAKSCDRLARIAKMELGWSDQDVRGFRQGQETAERMVMELQARINRR